MANVFKGILTDLQGKRGGKVRGRTEQASQDSESPVDEAEKVLNVVTEK